MCPQLAQSRLTGALLLLTCACNPRSHAPEAAAEPQAVHVVDLPHRVPNGLSGLAAGRNNQLLAVAEKTRAVVELDGSGNLVAVLPVSGIPSALEAESIAILDGGRLAIGTESDEPHRESDLILIAARTPTGYRVTAEFELSYTGWTNAAPTNRGIEGLCSADGHLFAASESVETNGDRRWAPLAALDLERGTWRYSAIRLSSRSGKLAGLTCRRGAGNTIEFAAIERHVDVRRLLQWRWHPKSLAPPDAPRVLLDFTDAVTTNPEGLAWDVSGQFYVVTDNYFRAHRDGNGMLLRVGPIRDNLAGNVAE